MIYALLETFHLLFHDPYFNIEGLVQLHESIDMRCQPINTVFHHLKSLIHLFSEIAKFKTKLCV